MNPSLKRADNIGFVTPLVEVPTPLAPDMMDEDGPTVVLTFGSICNNSV